MTKVSAVLWVTKQLTTLALLVGFTMAVQGKTFAIVAKSVDDGNFIAVWRGCQQAALLQGDDCVLLGGQGPAQLRAQEKAIRDAIRSDRFQGIAISVINSSRVALALKGVDMPVVTFDSPLDKKRAHLSQAYIGINNAEVGKNLAWVAERLGTNQKQICLMTDMHDENLSLRMRGVREQLGIVGGKNNELSLWREWHRCPWNTSDNVNRSLVQLKGTLSSMRSGVFISLGHWLLLDGPSYRAVVAPFVDQFASKELSVVIAIGAETEPLADALMHEGLLHGYVSIDFELMGRKTYQVLRTLSEGGSVEPFNYVENTLRFMVDNSPRQQLLE